MILNIHYLPVAMKRREVPQLTVANITPRMLNSCETSKLLLVVANLMLFFAVIVCSKRITENVSYPNYPSISTHTLDNLKTVLYKTTGSSDKLNFTTTYVNMSRIFHANDCLARNKYRITTLGSRFPKSFGNLSSTKDATEKHNLEPKLPAEFIPGEIQFTIGARDLPSMDPNNGAPDPFAELTGAIGYASTSVAGDDRNPNWPEVFTVFYMPEKVQEISIYIRDKDPIYPDDSIGWATFTVVDIVEPCNTYYTVICDRGRIIGALLISRPCGSTGATSKTTGYLLFVLLYFVIKTVHL